MGYGIGDMEYGVWGMGYGVWDVGYEMWDMGELQWKPWSRGTGHQEHQQSVFCPNPETQEQQTTLS